MKGQLKGWKGEVFASAPPAPIAATPQQRWSWALPRPHLLKALDLYKVIHLVIYSLPTASHGFLLSQCLKFCALLHYSGAQIV